MAHDWIFHDSHSRFFRSPFGAVPCKQRITLQLKVETRSFVDYVVLRFRQEGQEEQAFKLGLIREEGNEKIFRVEVETPSEPGLVWYYFAVKIDGKVIYYGNNAQRLGGPGSIYDHIPPAYQITVFQEAKVPAWFKGSVMYQIFVDRFYNGTEDGRIINPKKNSLIHSHWDNTPIYIRDKESGRVVRWDFFGGNLLGVLKKLPYLKSLGISCIYLNPIFESPSNHKYDTADYHRIDPMFGDNDIFKRLCDEAREMGISIILDGVFSHIGSDSIYFNKEGNYDSLGAFQSKESPYYNWFVFKGAPICYDCWWGIDTLPNVNELEPSYQRFIIFEEDSVLRFWQRMGTKGWRLDVVDELPDEFVKNFRRVMKEEDPEAVLIGEVWEDASNKESYGKRREYLLGKELDSAMNYPFRNSVLSFLTGHADAQATNHVLMSLYENYPSENFYGMMNLVGSHDVPRALTIFQEGLTEGLSLERKREIGEGRLKLAALWQLTFPGVPCVYYGDEAGVEGESDPLNRKTYPWGLENQTLLDWYKELIALRNHYDVLKSGRWLPLYARGDVYAFARVSENNTAIVLFNRNPEQEIKVSLNVGQMVRRTILDVLDDYREAPIEDDHLAVTLKPLEGKIYIQDRWSTGQQIKRSCGILLHPTSLPSAYGIGDLGQEAYEFVDFLAQSRQKLWQILSLNPPGFGDSPYQCFSAFAGNPWLIDPEGLVVEGLLEGEELNLPSFEKNQVEFDRIKEFKEKLFRKAFQKFLMTPQNREYENFIVNHKGWLEDFALFMALKERFGGGPWYLWDESLRWREEGAMDHYRDLLAEEIGYHKFLQFKFFGQWKQLKNYAADKGIKIIGDMPIFVAPDSADVWVNPHFFEIDREGKPAKVAGVPPDYFSKTGQRWGNPLYRWDELAKEDYKWWRDRFSILSELVDIIRIDHFRGFEGYWEVPAHEETAEKGRWVKGPGDNFFAVMRKYLGEVPVIAEDLGFITPEVKDLRVKFGFPGMKIMQFEMDPGRNEFRLSLAEKNNVVYTGSHDNDTILGWLRDHGYGAPEEGVWSFIEMAYRSDADTVIIPLQDVLGLGSEARMNTPGTLEGNWLWRFTKNQLTEAAVSRLKELAKKYNR